MSFRMPDWIEDQAPLSHKLIRIILFISSFTWAVNPIQDFMGDSTPLEKVATRMIPLILVAGYCLQAKNRSRLKNLLHPLLLPLLWYILIGTIGGFTGIQPALTVWKGTEVTIALMWMAVSCYDADSTRREFIAIIRCTEVLLLITVVLAFINPALGFQRSQSMIPWLKGYYPIINPNALGFMSVFALTRLLFFPAKYKFPRILLVSFTLLCAQSRTSYAVTGLVLLLVVIQCIRNKQLGRVFVAMSFGLFALCLGLGWFDTIVTIFMRGQDAEGFSTLSGRTNYWDFTLDHVSWIGGGLATGSRSLIFLSENAFYKGLVGTHNSFVEALIGAGYIGAIPFIIMQAWFLIRQAARTFNTPNESNFLFLSFGCIFFARGMTSMVLALYSFDFVVFTIYFAWQISSDQKPAAPLPRPKPVVYEKTLSEMAKANTAEAKT